MQISINKFISDMVATGKRIPKSLRAYFPKPTKDGRSYGDGCFPRNPKIVSQMNAMHEKIHGKQASPT